MITTSKHAPNYKGQDKDMYFTSQYNAVYKCLQVAPKTMLMVAHETGIERASICRYIATMRKMGSVQAIKREWCKISKHKATYYTTRKF